MKPRSWALPELDWQAIQQIAAHRNVVIDSRKIQTGDVFLAYKGDGVDGRSFIAEAIAAGAGAVLWEKENFQWDPLWQVPHLPIPQLRAQAGIIAAHLYAHPSHTMCAVGITGTNGKTSIAHWLAQAWNALGKQSVVIGTLGNGFIDRLTLANLTTPDAATLQTLLAQYHQQGATHLAMEVSSHALVQGRAHGVEFDIAVLTNLTREHLDYHEGMQQYGQAKSRLFEWEGLQAAVMNADDPFSQELLSLVRAPTILRYGIQQGDIRARQIESTLTGLTVNVLTPWGETTFSSGVIGRFNVYNLLATLSTLLASGVALSDATQCLQGLTPVLGRMQKVGGEHLPLVIVDYAHTPDALEKTLTTIRDIMPPTGKLYCVFGCGGGRDPGKRAMMAETVASLADIAIVTSDNPRMEAPQQIINDIVAALPTTFTFVANVDRDEAIAYAIKQAQVHDVICIAGKGHETYQEIEGVQYYFNDAQVATHYLAEWRAP